MVPDDHSKDPGLMGNQGAMEISDMPTYTSSDKPLIAT